MADRFYCPSLPASGPIVLEGDESRHLARVARRGVGDTVEVFDGQGRGVLAEVVAVEKDRVRLCAGEPVADRVAPLDLTVLVAPPKGERLDWLVEKLTELGVARLVPIRCERSVVDPRSSKLERLRRAVIEAAKQSGRNRLMQIEEAISAETALTASPASIRLFADLGEGRRADLAGLREGGSAALAIGPEGGWSPGERDLAASLGWGRMDLGATRLRVETAAIVGAAALFSHAREGPR